MDSLLLRPFASSPRPRLFSSPSLRGGCSRAQYSVQQELRFGRIQGCLNSSRRFGRIQGCLNSSCATVNSVRLQKSSHVKSTSGHSLESEPDDYTSASKGGAVLDSLHALYKFSRPHTIIGTALSIVSVSLLAVENLSDISPCFFAGLLEAVVAALFMNIYIVGLNQLFDIEIDKVNKPDLPLASGEYSIREGIAIIAASAVMSFGIGWIVGSWPLFWALFISFILGTAYSINRSCLLRHCQVSDQYWMDIMSIYLLWAYWNRQNFHYGRNPGKIEVSTNEHWKNYKFHEEVFNDHLRVCREHSKM